MWRVYYIFHNPSAKKKRSVPRDWMLFLGVLAMFGAFATIMIGVIIFDDYKATEVEDAESNTERDENKVLVAHYNLVCDGKRSLIWIIIIFAYILAAQLVAVYLAFRTRKVKIKALNDAKYLAFIIYITTFIITSMIIGAVSLRNFLNADAAVFSTGLFLFTTSILALLFVPKMVILYKDPNGEFIFNRSMSQAQGTNISLSDGEREKLRDLESHCRDLESRLGKYEHVKPFRSPSKTRLGSSNVDLTSSTQISSSISKPPLNDIGMSFPQNLHPPTPPSSGYGNIASVNGSVDAVVEKT
jgi:gamma-aminobutyric acid type B receptor